MAPSDYRRFQNRGNRFQKGSAAMRKIVRLGIAARGSYADERALCTKFDHVRCGWHGVRF
jgi:hypothetical protein